MAGRGRGRARGRATPVADSSQPPPQVAAPQPTSAPPPATGRGGRGRGRGASAAPPAAAQVEDESSRTMRGGMAPTPATDRNDNKPNGQLADSMGNMNLNGGQGDVRQNQQARGGANRQQLPAQQSGAAAQNDDQQERYTRMSSQDEENLSSSYMKGFVMRPDSIKGPTVQLMANAIMLHPPSQADRPVAYVYHVDFLPSIDSKKLRVAIVKHNGETRFNNLVTLYDGGSSIFCNRLINGAEKETIEFDHTTPRGETIHVTMRNVESIFVGGSAHLRIAGVMMKRGLGELKYVPMGRHNFDPVSKIQLDARNELWPGYSTAVNKYEGGMMLVADTQFKLASKRTVYDEMMDIHQNSSKFQDDCVNKLVGRIIYTPYNQKRHRIDDINFEMNPSDTFEKKGQAVSFAQYYEEAYGKRINDLRQPLLVSQPKEKDRRRGMTQSILLIPELCYITGISDEQRADFRFTKMMGEHTRHPPERRAKDLLSLVSRFTANQEVNKSFTDWNMQFDKRLVQLTGKRLPSPGIIFQQPVDYNKNSADFGGALRNVRFKSAVSVPLYGIFFTQRDGQTAKTLSESLQKVGSGFGMNFGQCVPCSVQSPRAGDFTQALQNFMAQQGKQGAKIVIFVLPDNRADRYNAIKKSCYVDQPIPSQCVLAKTLSKPQGLMSVVSKLAMQMNAKLGGEPWHTDFNSPPGMQVLGMDVYHAGKNKTKSCVGIVGSLNKTFSRYYSRAYTNNQEDSHCLGPALTAMLNRYKQENGEFPKYVVMFRDGVGEGQLHRVQDNEVKSFLNAMEALGCTAKLCFVVVTKRITQRFFASNNGRLDNPMPGTVVYDTLTKKDRFDFFLAPTSSRQGTVTPTHYNVIKDDTPFKTQNGTLMEMAFHLSHLYFNWTGAIRVPSVCQYAHKLAALCGDSLSNTEPSVAMADTLYYL